MVAGDEHGFAADQAATHCGGFAPGRAPDGTSDQMRDHRPQVGLGLGRISGAHKGGQGDLMPLGKVLQHVIAAHLGSGVERIRQNLGQKENIHI